MTLARVSAVGCAPRTDEERSPLVRDAHATVSREALRSRWLGIVPYGDALALQESLLDERIAGGPDTVLLLEHPAVYTLGRGADAADLLDAPERLGVPVFRVGRGGGATFHGPGQLVAYPIVRLRASGRDVHGYVRTLEHSLIETCATYGVEAYAPQGRTGVWIGDAKIASIGIGVRRGVAWHGIALNVATDLSYFAQIVVCRGEGARVTNLSDHVRDCPPVAAVGATFAGHLAARLDLSDAAVEEAAWR